MKCDQCGGETGSASTVCLQCAPAADLDLSAVPFREHGLDASLQCPDCVRPLQVIEVGSSGVLIERCPGCSGWFFNPGELESVLDTKAHPVDLHPIIAGLDDPALSTANDPRVKYRKCPACAEVMNRFNFGKQSGVILDRCRTHGIWLEGGEFRRIAEWWHAGGSEIHQRNEKPRVMSAAIPAVIIPPSPTESSSPDWLSELPVDAAVEIALEGLLAVISSITD